jgi:hypothetical protein
MIMIRSKGLRGLLPLSLLLLLIAGCESADGRREISGTVTLKGEPLDDGWIEFLPQNNSTDQLVTKSGATITNGKYVIGREHGLVAGKYRVIISSGEKNTSISDDGGTGPKNIFSKERIPADYNVESKQVVDVTEEGPNKFDYQIP